MKFKGIVIRVLLLVPTIFLGIFGYQLLQAAYNLKSPFHFLAIFFSATFVILVSLAFLVGLCLQVVQGVRESRERIIGKHPSSE